MNQPAKSGGHPRGLYVLFAIEMWERFNYYGMRSILVFFMTQALLFKSDFSSNLYGSYLSLLYLTPLLGGYIADRYWGNKRSIFVGGLVMAAGEGVLFICGSIYYSSSHELTTALFYSGLGLMVAGMGFFKPNISSLVGQLYPKGDRRKDAAYTIFYMGINLGAAIGPIVCGTVGNTRNPADFKWAFLAGGVGMLLSLLIQKIFYDKYVVDPNGKPLGGTPGETVTASTVVDPLTEHEHPVKAPPKSAYSPITIIIAMAAFSALMIGAMYLDTRVNYIFYLLIACTLIIAFTIFSDNKLTHAERQRVWVMFIIAFFVVFFWGAYEQTGASLSFFAEKQTNLNIIGNYSMPPSYFQSFNSVFIIIFAPVLAWLWLKLGKREPATPTKMALGLILLALGFLWIAFGVKNGSSGIKVSMIWLTGLYFLHTLGELCLSPIGLSLFNKLSPFKFSSLLMAVWFLGNAAGGKLAGVLSALYPENGKTTSFLGYHISSLYDFFMLFVFMAGIAAAILLLLSKRLQKMMHGIT